MRIEKMTAACIDAVAAIEAECFSHPWSKKSLEESLEKENSLFLVAVEDEKVIGYVGIEVIVDEGYIFNVAVSADYRRRGMGYALVRELVTYSMKNSLCFITLEVRESNSAAISLYSKFGFIKAGERKNYYSDPTEAAVLMTKYF
ncbi:MAG: ribosomal protein S18-alanine N-acetyltransferase [Ruminococcus sp.]|nr:ribosomal protein S18-alanine N-acetyltransferase [Ruminococcus sp.]